MYPNKKGKGQVSEKTKLILLNIGNEEMVRAIDRYKSELDKDKDWRKPQNGSTFFNSGYIDYIDANYQPSKTQPKCGSYMQNDYDFATLEEELRSN